MYVVFLHGPAASGKHTIASRISESTGLPLFHNHLAVDVAKSLFPFGSASFNYLRATIWLSAFAEAAKTGQSFIFTFNPEATVNPALIEEMCAYVSAVGGKVHFVQLICSRETVLSRIANSSRARFGKLIDPVAFELIEASGGFNFPDLPTPVLVVDTEKNTPEEAASLIVRAVGDLQRDA